MKINILVHESGWRCSEKAQIIGTYLEDGQLHTRERMNNVAHQMAEVFNRSDTTPDEDVIVAYSYDANEIANQNCMFDRKNKYRHVLYQLDDNYKLVEAK